MAPSENTTPEQAASAEELNALLEHALARHQAGALAIAAELYQRVLRVRPGDPTALHYLGVALGQIGQFDRALPLLRASAAASPTNPVFRNNLGDVALRAGLAEEAEAAFREATRLAPDNAQYLANLGASLSRLGRWEDAETTLRAALMLDPAAPEALSSLAAVLDRTGRTEAAMTLLQQAVDATPHDPSATLALARLLWRQERPAEAEPLARRVALADPSAAAPAALLGVVLAALGRHVEAVASLRAAVAAEPGNKSHWFDLGNAVQGLGDYTGAVEAYGEALALDPDYADAWSNRGNALHHLGRIEEAEASYRTALDGAPDNALAHFNLAVMLLSEGRYAEGFEEYEWRWETPKRRQAKRAFDAPVWDGAPLPAGPLLIHTEQGFGDCLMFARFVAEAAARCGQPVALESYPPLTRLFQTLPGVSTNLARDRDPPPWLAAHLPLLSLPRLLGARLDTLPGTPYLRAPDPSPALASALAAAGQATAGQARRIGLVWSGNPDQANNRARSVDPLALVDAVAAPGHALFSLQVGAQASDLGGRITDLAPMLTDFAETAAAITALDLVISVDTAVAHLAGALGQPVWVLLHWMPAWQWISTPARPDAPPLGHRRSPWYGSARLFQQDVPGEWDAVLARLRAALQERA